MNRLLLFNFLLIISIGTIYSQEERIVCGTLKDKSGEPLPGVSINIKGTVKGVITDINGKYCIQAPLGSVLIYSFIGFLASEVSVSYRNSEPLSNNPSKIGHAVIKSSYTPIYQGEFVNNDTIENLEGTAKFSQTTASYKVLNPNSNWFNQSATDPGKIMNIDFGSDNPKISLLKNEYIKIPHITFLSSCEAAMFNKLPKIQNEYAQGRPVNGISQWRGPETGEIFSWGPAIRNLEYDGSNYEYDKNGRIVFKGQGTGRNVTSYNPYTFFRTGTTFYNYIKIHEKYNKKEYAITLSNKDKQGIIPNSYKHGNYFDARFKHIFHSLDLSSRITYDGFHSSMMSGSPGLSLIMASILTTPVTFDNTNGLSPKDASKNRESYLLENQMQRSFAPGIANNPYWLINNIIDKENQKAISFSFKADFRLSKNLCPFIKGDIQYQKYTNIFSYPENTASIGHAFTTNRTDKLSSYACTSGLKFDLNKRNITINSQIVCNLNYSNRLLQRKDYYITNDSLQTFGNSVECSQHNLEWTTNFTLFNWLLGNFSNHITNSNIYKHQTLYSPSFSSGINIHRLFDYTHPIDFLKFRSYWGINYSDIPLAYTYGNFDFLKISSAQSSEAAFFDETITNFSLNPEKIIKKGIGFDLDMFNYRFSINFDVYQNKTTHGIFPVLESNSPILKNIADDKTWGIDADLSLRLNRYYSRFNTSLRFIFSSYKNQVTKIENNLSEVPLAGFSDIHTALIKGQPKGVIVGTTYRYNENRKMIIGDDGFPLVNNKLEVIGNPNPDYTIGFETNCTYKSFSLSILMEFRKGGEVWNGTENALSYLGLAAKTVAGRTIHEYIFPGVKTDGSINSTLVNFADPANPFEANRWYRYGPTGVAEDAIQDASSIRIKEITLSYAIKNQRINYEFTVFTQNPLLITKYKGVDPESTLWGKANASGLDLFNYPNSVSMGVSFKIVL